MQPDEWITSGELTEVIVKTTLAELRVLRVLVGSIAGDPHSVFRKKIDAIFEDLWNDKTIMAGEPTGGDYTSFPRIYLRNLRLENK